MPDAISTQTHSPELRRRSRRLASTVVLVGLAVAGLSGRACAQGEEDGFALLREQQLVTGAAKRAQPLSQTPSAVTVITQAEIRAQGYHTLGDALRWVRGLFLTYDRNYSYLGVRGFQRPGDYNNKVLVAIDGHAVNGNVYGDAPFDNELGIDLETVERIEVVRGPGSALYGSYAVFAVVNVVTHRPGRDPGLAVDGRYGEEREEGRGFVSLSSQRPGSVAWTLSGSWLSARGADLYFGEFDRPETNFGRAVDRDGERAAAVLGGAEWGGFRLAAKWNRREKHVPTGAFGSAFNDPHTETVDGHDFVELSWSRPLGTAVDGFARAYWDGTRYYGTYPYDSDSGSVLNFDRGDGDQVGAEWRTNWSPSAVDILTFGIEGRRELRTRQENFDESPYQVYVDDLTTRNHWAAYAQEERRFGNTLRLTAGARVDGYSDLETVLSPRADLVWQLDRATTAKVLYGSAFRAPSPYETNYTSYGIVANADLRPERVRSIEATLERRFGGFTASACAYLSHVLDLIDLVTVDSAGTGQYRNASDVSSRGTEAELSYVGPAGARGRLAVALQDSDIQGTLQDLSNSPRWNAHLVLAKAPEGGRASFGLGIRYLSPRLTLKGNRTDPALRTDLRVGVRPDPRLELGLEIRNLFDARYGDPGSQEHVQDQIPQDARTVFLTISGRPPLRL